uniref:Uncharacterized protein n=1 Tax=Glossina austeni TaxID=7395 RepID=A0A1A9V6U7_GLOAU
MALVNGLRPEDYCTDYTLQALKIVRREMDKACESFFPGLELGAECHNWFLQMAENCVQPGDTQWFEALKNLAFPVRDTSISLSIDAHHLNFHQCNSLLMEAINDYFLKMPLYSKGPKVNALCWNTLLAVIVITVMLLFFIIAACVYCEFTNNDSQRQDVGISDVSKPEMRMVAVSNISLRVAREEVRRLKVQFVVYSEETSLSADTSVLVLRVSSHIDAFSNHVCRKLQTSCRLYRVKDKHVNSKKECQDGIWSQTLDAVGDCSRKMRLLIEFSVNHISDTLSRTNSSNSSSQLSFADTVSPRISHRGNRVIGSTANLEIDKVCCSELTSSARTSQSEPTGPSPSRGSRSRLPTRITQKRLTRKSTSRVEQCGEAEEKN